MTRQEGKHTIRLVVELLKHVAIGLELGILVYAEVDVALAPLRHLWYWLQCKVLVALPAPLFEPSLCPTPIAPPNPREESAIAPPRQLPLPWRVTLLPPPYVSSLIAEPAGTHITVGVMKVSGLNTNTT